MKRKLVNYEVFEKMKEDSLSAVVNELIESQDHLAKILGTPSLVLESFDDSTVVYQKDDGTYIKSTYRVENDSVLFDNMEELVIDEASESLKRREIVSKMLEAVLDDRVEEANYMFEKFMELASLKHKRDGQLVSEENLDEAYVRIYGTRGKNGPKVSIRQGAKDPKKAAAAKKGHRLHASSYKAGGRKRHAGLTSERSRRGKYKNIHGRLHALSGGKQYGRHKKHMNEWLTLANNVFEYADFVENGYSLSESTVRTDDKGNLTAVRIPTTKVRNEGKILKMHFDKMIKQDAPKVMRETALRLANNQNFIKAMAELKRNNNLSDNVALENTLEKVVTTFPEVLYLTQDELSKIVSLSLEQAGIVKYDDELCNFMAEGILRTAHHAFSERAEKLMGFAKVEIKESEDSYKDFQVAMKGYFSSLDEQIKTEMKVFEDLYNAVLDVRRLALESQNEEVRADANDFVGELESVLNGKAPAKLDFAVEVADWLNDIAEANLPGAGDWSVVKTPHHTVSGDHPQMAKNAKVDGIPSEYPGDWGDPAPMIGQDSNAWNHGDEARNRSWGNKGGNKVWPDLNNPNHLPSVDYKMKEKSVVDDNDDFGGWSSADTWAPEGGLSNPYVPKPADVFKQKVDTSEKGKLD